MSSSGCFLLCALFLFAFLIELGTSLECYSCTSYTNEHCNDPFNATLLKSSILKCNERNYGCMKQKIAGEGGSGVSVHRGCTLVAFCEPFKKVSQHCSVCTTDLCNSSPVARPFVTLMILVPLIGYFLYY